MAAQAPRSLLGRARAQLADPATREYLKSTHFWGPLCNWMIPMSTIMETQREPKFISGKMTLALTGYSCAFMRFSLVVRPRNLLLFACHSVNLGAQLVQGCRFLLYQRQLRRDGLQSLQ